MLEVSKHPGEEAAFFCDKTAYGRSARNISHAETYWRNIVDNEQNYTMEWRDLVQELPIPFAKANKFLETPTSRFPQIGELTRFLVLGDLSYAGVVVPPTVEEVGATVGAMDKGAANLLVRMELVAREVQAESIHDRDGSSSKLRKGKIGRGQTKIAFQNTYEHVNRYATDKEKGIWGFDAVMTEHSACKCHKAVGKGFYTL